MIEVLDEHGSKEWCKSINGNIVTWLERRERSEPSSGWAEIVNRWISPSRSPTKEDILLQYVNRSEGKGWESFDQS